MNNHFYKGILQVAAIFGAIGVMVGAFGAHFLASRLQEKSIDVLRTGILYLFVHTLAILFVVHISKDYPYQKSLKYSSLFFIIGILFFSGSLFLIATETMTGLSPKYYGFITPVGGLFFIAGWLMLFAFSLSKKS